MPDQNGNGAEAPQTSPKFSVLAQYTKDLSFENPNAPRTLGPQQTAPNIAGLWIDPVGGHSSLFGGLVGFQGFRDAFQGRRPKKRNFLQLFGQRFLGYLFHPRQGPPNFQARIVDGFLGLPQRSDVGRLLGRFDPGIMFLETEIRLERYAIGFGNRGSLDFGHDFLFGGHRGVGIGAGGPHHQFKRPGLCRLVALCFQGTAVIAGTQGIRRDIAGGFRDRSFGPRLGFPLTLESLC